MTAFLAWPRDRCPAVGRVGLTLLLVAAVVLGSAGTSVIEGAVAQGRGGERRVIVVLKDGSDAAGIARAANVAPSHVYQRVITGFAARLPEAAIAALSRNPRVLLISPDRTVEIAAQTLPAGIDRVDADVHPGAGIGSGGRVDVDVAVLDTGIDPNHADLTVAGGTDCTGTGSWADNHGHGTHVAGTVGAKENDAGVVGVAPGARLWAVKVLGSNGSGTWSQIICGLDWVYQNRATIEVANMSLSGAGQDGACTSEALHQAICNLVAGGVPVVVAAGNAAQDAATSVPAAYDEVITVSAFADFDGKPGGTGSATCSTNDRDDRFASFSNYGADVDIAAPGRCVRSTTRGGGTGLMSGTSMAAPHVAGAAALYRAEAPGASPAQVRDWLLSTASRAQGSAYGFTGDPDGQAEPVLNLDVGAPAPAPEPEPEPEPTLPSLGVVGHKQSSNSTGAALASDGDPATAWRTTAASIPSSAWVRFDLGKKLSIAEIRWQFSQVGFADQFKVQVSSDAVTWKTLATRGNAAAAGTWETLATTVSARYVRFNFSNPNKDATLGYLSEVRIFGPAAGVSAEDAGERADRGDRGKRQDERDKKKDKHGKKGKQGKKGR